MRLDWIPYRRLSRPSVGFFAGVSPSWSSPAGAAPGVGSTDAQPLLPSKKLEKKLPSPTLAPKLTEAKKKKINDGASRQGGNWHS